MDQSYATIGILIYEDNVHFRTSIMESLNTCDEFKVLGAFENCNKVVEHIESLHPDIVLMDISMPGVNGLEGLSLIRSKKPELPVIILTVFEDNDNIYDAICLGASGYLLKASNLDGIPKAISEVLAGGAPMTPSVAKKVLTAFQKTKTNPSKEFGLSNRETQILNLLTTGYSYKMIAEECFISLETVRSHIKKIYEKLQVHSATEASNKIHSLRKH